METQRASPPAATAAAASGSRFKGLRKPRRRGGKEVHLPKQRGPCWVCRARVSANAKCLEAITSKKVVCYGKHLWRRRYLDSVLSDLNGLLR